MARRNEVTMLDETKLPGSTTAAGDDTDDALDDGPEYLGLSDYDEPATEPAPGDETPDAEQQAATTEDKPAEPQAADDDTTRYASFGRSWETAFTNDPVGSMIRLAEALESSSPGVKAQVLAALGGATTAAPESAPAAQRPELVPTSEIEEAILPHLAHIQKLGDVIASTERLGEIATRSDNIENDMIGLSIVMRAQQDLLNAYLRDVAGLDLPRFDAQEVFGHLNTNPKATLEDAYNQVYGAKLAQAVAVAKQRQTERPKTLRNGSGGTQTRRKVRSLMEAWDEVGREIGV